MGGQMLYLYLEEKGIMDEKMEGEGRSDVYSRYFSNINWADS